MITRSHVKGDAPSTAVYSDCELYRYSLTRIWHKEGQRLNFVMLNPSKATEVQNDPTIERCERRARALGYGGVSVTNIFAWRETDPRAMRRATDPIGPENDKVIRDQALWADHVIAAWGAHGAHLGRGPIVARLLFDLGCSLLHLGLTQQGHPKHPLYISYKTEPERWANH